MPPPSPDVCPACGTDVPPRAQACPECGADETTGWSGDTYLDGIDLPEPPENSSRLTSRKLAWSVIAIVILILLVADVLWGWVLQPYLPGVR